MKWERDKLKSKQSRGRKSERTIDSLQDSEESEFLRERERPERRALSQLRVERSASMALVLQLPSENIGF